jgi:hypothetical protein
MLPGPGRPTGSTGNAANGPGFLGNAMPLVASTENLL